ncbi:hypothetical protein [Streptomyces sp. NPDC057287]|uniref:hypothetical protein n=1 Tax=Streptomyces sp. NPDC057287 TaxID=3346086 RepID=UPI0036282B68
MDPAGYPEQADRAGLHAAIAHGHVGVGVIPASEDLRRGYAYGGIRGPNVIDNGLTGQHHEGKDHRIEFDNVV